MPFFLIYVYWENAVNILNISYKKNYTGATKEISGIILNKRINLYIIEWKKKSCPKKQYIFN